MIKLQFLLFFCFGSLVATCSVVVSKEVDTSVYDSKKNKINAQAAENEKIKCRYVCDKKVYKEQKISEAIEFYKTSKDYKFNRD